MPAARRRPALVAFAAGLLAVAALGTAACDGPEPQRLKIGMAYDHPGLSLLVTSEAVGVDAQVGRYLAADLGARGRDEVSFIDHPARSRFAAVATGTVRFALGSDPVPPQHAGDVVAIGPYLVGGLQLAVRAGSTTTGPPSLAGRRVCVVSAGGADDALERVVPGAVPAPRPTLSTCLTDLAEGRAEAVLEDGIALHGALAGPAYSSLRVLPRRLTTTEHVVLAPKDDPDLCRRLTASLRRMVSTGAWARAVEGDLVTTGALDAVPAAPAVHGCG